MAFQIVVFLHIFFLILTLAWLWRHGRLALLSSLFKSGVARTCTGYLTHPFKKDGFSFSFFFIVIFLERMIEVGNTGTGP